MDDEKKLAEIVAHIGCSEAIWQTAARKVVAKAGSELMRKMPGSWTLQDILEQLERNASDIEKIGGNDE